MRARQRASTPLGTCRRRRARDCRRGEARETGALTRALLLRVVVGGLVKTPMSIVTVFWPGITMLALIFLLGIRFILMGALQLAAASRLQDEVKSQVLHAIGGLASLLLGILAFMRASPRSCSSRCSVRSRSSSGS